MRERITKEEKRFVYLHKDITNCANDIIETMEGIIDYIKNDNHYNNELASIYLSLGYTVLNLYNVQNNLTSYYGIEEKKDKTISDTMRSWDALVEEIEAIEKQYPEAKPYVKIKKKVD